MAPSVLSSTVAAASKLPAASDARPHDSSLPQGEGPVRKNQQQLKCPRCGSNNTKFCYYNNYSTAQPRHFCRACRRYWTQGGTLRDVPVGGASRRNGNKRRRISDEPSSASPPLSALMDAYPDVPAFPFVSDGIYLPQFDHGVAPAASALPPVVPGYFDGFTPWDDVNHGIGVAGAWDDIADIELSWPPPDN